MLKQAIVFITASALSAANAYATQAPVEGEREFPLAMVFGLIAVACAVATSLFAASQKKKD